MLRKPLRKKPSLVKRALSPFARILSFFKLTDVSGKLSLTNVAFYIFLYKIATCSMGEITANDLALALSTVGLYFGKKVVNAVKDMKGVGPIALEKIAEARKAAENSGDADVPVDPSAKD